MQESGIGSAEPPAALQKQRTSTTDGQKFRKKPISEYLAGFDGSGSNGKQEEQIHAGGNVPIAHKRDIVLDFHPKDSVVSEQLNEQQALTKYSPLEQPKTPGARHVEPFTLTVPSAEPDIASFNPSEQTEFNNV